MHHTKGLLQTSPPSPHPEDELAIAHRNKIYFSGSLVRRVERQPNGQKPSIDEGWTEIWAQLCGTILSVWETDEIQGSVKQSQETPTSCINVTNAFVQVLGSITTRDPTAPVKRYTNILTLNNAGSNLLLFSCPSKEALISWAASLRLAAWEKSRIEEVYTSHILRSSVSACDAPTTLVQGKMEGWASVRVAGRVEWQRLFVVVQKGTGPDSGEKGDSGFGNDDALAQPRTIKKKLMPALFFRDVAASASLMDRPMISMYTGSKPKDRKKPVLTVHSVSQAYALHPTSDLQPEHPELVNKNTMIKVEGTFGDGALAAGLRTQEGWVVIMPELEESAMQAAETLKWVVALHDAFGLYGRPKAWTWDPYNPLSLMFGYTAEMTKQSLFLSREAVESMDARIYSTSAVRTEMKHLLLQHMQLATQAVTPITNNSCGSFYNHSTAHSE